MHLCDASRRQRHRIHISEQLGHRLSKRPLQYVDDVFKLSRSRTGKCETTMKCDIQESHLPVNQRTEDLFVCGRQQHSLVPQILPAFGENAAVFIAHPV